VLQPVKQRFFWGRLAASEIGGTLAELAKGSGRIVAFDATRVAEEAEDPIATNMVMLGALASSGVLPYPEELIREAVRESVPARFLELNLCALDAGRKETLSRRA